METSETTATLRDYLRIIFRRKMLFVIVVIPTLMINYVMLEFNTPSYTASVKMLLKEEQIATSKEDQYKRIYGGAEFFLGNQEAIVASNYIVEPVVRALKLYELPDDREIEYAKPLKKLWLEYVYKKFNVKRGSPVVSVKDEREDLIAQSAGQWKGNIAITADVTRSTVFYIKVSDFNGGLAAKVADAISRSYLVFDLEQQISELQLKYGEKHSAVKQLQDYTEILRRTLGDRTVPDLELIPSKIRILESAQVAPIMTKSKGSVLTFAFFAGILISLILIVVFEYFDPTIKSPKDVETVLKTPLLGSIPKIKAKNKLINSANANPDYVRAYKNLADNIYLLMNTKQFKSVLVTDVDYSGDTYNIIANIGMYLSQHEGHNVLIVDVNLRKPVISEIFGISSNESLVDILEGKIPYEEVIKNAGSNLYILPASMPVSNPVSLLGSSKMADLVKDLCGKFDLVFFYCAGLKNFKDAVILSSLTNCTILVVNEGMTHQHVTRQIIQPLEKNANLVGAILNNRSYGIPNILYKLT